MIRTIALGLVSISLLSVGQTSFKVGLNSIGGMSLSEGLGTVTKIVQTPWILLGFLCYGLSSVLWLDVLSNLPYTMAFPLVGLTYVFTILIGHFVFHEPIGWLKLFGVACILAGIFFIFRAGIPQTSN